METQMEAVATPVVDNVSSAAAAEQTTVVSLEEQTQSKKTYTSQNEMLNDKQFVSWLKAGEKIGAATENQNFLAGDWVNLGGASFRLDHTKAHVDKGYLMRLACKAT